MLPKYWRLVAKNKTGQDLNYDSGARLAIRYAPWKRDPSGALVEGAEASDDFGFGAGDTIVDASWKSMDASGAGYIDNSSNKYEGIYGQLDVTADNASASGTVELFVEFSTNASNWPSDDAADPDTSGDVDQHLIGPIASVSLNGADTASTVFSWQAG